MNNYGLSFGLAVVALQTVMLAQPAIATGSIGEVDLTAKCGQCHDVADPAGKASEQWVNRLAAMGPVESLDADEQAEVLGFLRHHGWETAQLVTMAADRHLFEEKCSLCHSANRVFLEGLSEQDLRAVVERMRRREPHWLSPAEADTIVRFLLDGAPGVRKPNHVTLAGESPDMLFRVRCSGCHNLERVYLYLEATHGMSLSWAPMVERMRLKAPQWMSEEEAGKITAYLRTVQPQRP